MENGVLEPKEAPAQVSTSESRKFSTYRFLGLSVVFYLRFSCLFFILGIYIFHCFVLLFPCLIHTMSHFCVVGFENK